MSKTSWVNWAMLHINQLGFSITWGFLFADTQPLHCFDCRSHCHLSVNQNSKTRQESSGGGNGFKTTSFSHSSQRFYEDAKSCLLVSWNGIKESFWETTLWWKRWKYFIGDRVMLNAPLELSCRSRYNLPESLCDFLGPLLRGQHKSNQIA